MKYILFIVSIFVCSSLFGQSLGDIFGAGTSSKEEAKPQPTVSVKQSNGNAKMPKHISKEISQEEFDSIFMKASQGNDNAQLALGVLYARGVKPVVVNPELALEWLMKSANNGNLAAMTYIGAIYSEGKLVKRDINKAIYWREMAAEKGSAADKYALANAFIYGYMLPADKQKAFYWLTKAGEAGDVRAIDQLISIYTNNNDTQNAKRWKTEKSYAQIKLAQSGNVPAMYEAYRLYMTGKGGVYKSIPKAIFWLTKASDGGHILAMETLANMYIQGRYVGKDFAKGISLLEKLANNDAMYAMKISSIYGENGENQDLQKAEQWLDKAAEKLTNINKLHLIWKLWAGSGVLKNTKKASKYCADMINETKSENQKQYLSQIKTDIDSGKPAPKTFSELCK